MPEMEKSTVPLIDTVTSVLIIRCGALGDLIYATSVIDALRTQYGDTVTIDFVCTPGPGTLFKSDERVRRVFGLKHRSFPLWLSREKRQIITASRQHPYDLLINLEWGEQFHDLARAVHAKQKLGMPFSRPNLPKGVIHAADMIKAFYADAVSNDVLNKSVPRLIGTPEKALRTHYDLPERYLVINASNSHIKKQRINYRAWPQEHWKRLLELIDGSIPVVMIGGKGEERYFEHIRPFPAGTIDLVGKTLLSDLIGIIENAEAVVTTDTGPAHMAAAVNTPVFTLIGPTPEDETGPYKTPNNEVHILKSDVPCRPCYRTPVMEACEDNICMKQITPEMVYDALSPLLRS